MISQVRARTANRQDRVAREALSAGASWVRELKVALGSTIKPKDWAEIVGAVAIFRDRWEISTFTNPLGPVPANYEWEQTEQRESLRRQLQSLIGHPSSSVERGGAALPAPIVRQPLIHVGPTL